MMKRFSGLLWLRLRRSRRRRWRTRNRPTSCCATGWPPIPPIRTSRRTSRVFPISRRPISPPRSNFARSLRNRRGARCTSSAAPTPPTGKCRKRSRAWRKAADKGSTSAMVELGVLYGTGAGVARDEAQARKLFERAAKPAIRAASPILPRSAAAAVRRPIPRGRGNCWRRLPRPMRRRNISSA